MYHALMHDSMQHAWGFLCALDSPHLEWAYAFGCTACMCRCSAELHMRDAAVSKLCSVEQHLHSNKTLAAVLQQQMVALSVTNLVQTCQGTACRPGYVCFVCTPHICCRVSCNMLYSVSGHYCKATASKLLCSECASTAVL
jgi:hypothetical protein